MRVSERPKISLVQGKSEPVLAAGGGGPHDPTMEIRLAHLETDVATMRADLSATRADLGATRVDMAYIRGRLESLPTTWQMIGTVLAGNIGLAGLLFATVKLFQH
jgi:hypothetical protein